MGFDFHGGFELFDLVEACPVVSLKQLLVFLNFFNLLLQQLNFIECLI